MSFSFFLPCRVPPDFSETIDALPFAVACEEGDEVPSIGHWPEGFVYHFFVEGRSTRSVEVCFERDEFSVRLLVGSSPIDFEVAFAFLESAARLAGESRVDAEDGTSTTIAEFRTRYDDAWIEETSRQWAESLPAIVRESDSILSIHGPTRMFHLGPRLLDEMPTADFADSLRELMLKAFYPPSQFRSASTLVVRVHGREREICVWSGEPVILPRSDFVIVGTDEDAPMIAYDDAIGLAGADAIALDELQYRIDRIEAGRWLEIQEKATSSAVPLAALSQQSRRWWEFWK